MSSVHEDTKSPPVAATRPAVLYLRFSPKPDKKVCDETLESQREICLKYCESHNLHVAAVLEDPLVSARSVRLRDRSEGSKLDELLDGGIRDVVAVRLDRVFRDTVDGLETLNAWNAQGVSLHLANQGGCSVNCNTATGTMIATMLLAYASFEPALTSERTSSMMIRRQKTGQRMTGRKSIPWGWMLDPNDSARMVPCHEERVQSHYIKDIVKDNGGSLSLSAGIANDPDSKIGLCRGKPWDHGKVKRAMNATWDDEPQAEQKQ